MAGLVKLEYLSFSDCIICISKKKIKTKTKIKTKKTRKKELKKIIILYSAKKSCK